MVGSQEPKLALRMPIDDYINLKLALKERESWEKLGYEYKLKEGRMGETIFFF